MKKPATVRAHRTLVDMYEERDLTDAQVRRLVALLGLTGERPIDTRPAEQPVTGHEADTNVA